VLKVRQEPKDIEVLKARQDLKELKVTQELKVRRGPKVP
jgi:hypothetical protein